MVEEVVMKGVAMGVGEVGMVEEAMMGEVGVGRALDLGEMEEEEMGTWVGVEVGVVVVRVAEEKGLVVEVMGGVVMGVVEEVDIGCKSSCNLPCNSFKPLYTVCMLLYTVCLVLIDGNLQNCLWHYHGT